MLLRASPLASSGLPSSAGGLRRFHSQVLMSLNAILELELDKKYYQPKDLNKKNFNLNFPYNIFYIPKKVSKAL